MYLEKRHQEHTGIFRELWHFILHLRWHYQVFILSGGFLLGGLLSSDINVSWFVIQFANVHLLLFGGATAYNSFWDNDQGPIGGLRNPPEMSPWMWMASLMLQMFGVLLAIPEGGYFLTIYVLSMLFFWLYSTPWARWKSRPVKSLIAIGVSTGFNSVLLGYLAAGNESVPLLVFVTALGASLLLLSLYPISQIYQQDEDTRRGDQTFAIQYGEEGVRRFFVAGYFGGLLLISTVIIILHSWLGLIFGIIGVATGLIVLSKLNNLTARQGDYNSVMWIKYSTSLAFVSFLICALLLKHSGIRQIAAIAEVLLQ